MSEISALLSLLDDPDDTIFSEIKGRILSLGGDIIPELENTFETNFDTLVQQRALDLIHEIQFSNTLKALKNWRDDDTKSILEGIIIIAKYQYPDLVETKIKKNIEQLRTDIWLELNDELTALEKINVINHIIFDVHSFSGNTQNFHAPQQQQQTPTKRDPARIKIFFKFRRKLYNRTIIYILSSKRRHVWKH
jgi:hypothetical protein